MTTQRFKLTGSIVAIVTPFDNNDTIDYTAYEGLLNFHLENGTDGLVVCGTTGETPTLTDEEYSSLIAFTVKKVNHKIPVIAGVGNNSTLKTLQNIRLAESHGVDGLLIVSPYYNKPTQEGLYRHFSYLAENTKLPIILYNVPGRTGGNMSVDLTLRLANDFTNIVAIKEASGNMTQIMQIITNRPDGFLVYSGDDSLTLPIIALGGEGCISVVANEIPAAFSKLTHLALEGNLTEAQKIHDQYLKLMDLNFIESNPSPVKFALQQMGYINENVRMPLCTMEEKSKKTIEKELTELGLLTALSLY